MDTQLSPHLTEAEFLTTQHRELVDAQRQFWSETPAIQDAARRFAASVFEPARQLLGPLHVNSGFRCPALNAAVGGVATSRHMLGLAADVVPVELPIAEAMRRLAEAVTAGALPDVDQAIVECGTWIHLQGAPIGHVPRREVLASAGGKLFTRYTGGAA